MYSIDTQIKILREKKEEIDKKLMVLYREKTKNIQRLSTAYEIQQCEEICNENGILYEEVLNLKSTKQVMKAKRELVNHFREKGYTLERIAKILGFKCHASILYLLNNK